MSFLWGSEAHRCSLLPNKWTCGLCFVHWVFLSKNSSFIVLGNLSVLHLSAVAPDLLPGHPFVVISVVLQVYSDQIFLIFKKHLMFFFLASEPGEGCVTSDVVCLFASLHNSERCVEECGNRVTASAPNGVGSTLLPSHPLSLYPDKGKPFSRSDGAKHLWGSPFLYSIHPSILSSRSVFTPFTAATQLWCFLKRIAKELVRFSSWQANDDNGKGDPEWELLFLYRTVFCESLNM